jgi:hypothetical protein
MSGFYLYDHFSETVAWIVTHTLPVASNKTVKLTDRILTLYLQRDTLPETF